MSGAMERKERNNVPSKRGNENRGSETIFRFINLGCTSTLALRFTRDVIQFVRSHV